MGRSSAVDMIEQTDEMGMSRDTALLWHLQGNHYPPVASVFLASAKEAIDFVNCGDVNADVHLPNGKTLSALEIIEQLHLHCFLEEEDWAE